MKNKIVFLITKARKQVCNICNQPVGFKHLDSCKWNTLTHPIERTENKKTPEGV